VNGRLRWLAPLMIGVVVGVGACSDGESNDETPTVAAPAYSLVNPGNLTICTHAPYEPFEMQVDGDWTGFDMDLINAVAEGLELETNVVVTPFDGIWRQPAAGACDLVASALTITEARAAETLFTDPYFEAAQSLLVRADDAETYSTLESLAGRSIAVQEGTTGEAYAQEHLPPGAELVAYTEPAPMFLALQSQHVDAILQDLPVNGFRSTQDPTVALTQRFTTGEQYAFAVAPDNPGLAEAINAELADIREASVYDQIYLKWFGAIDDGEPTD